MTKTLQVLTVIGVAALCAYVMISRVFADVDNFEIIWPEDDDWWADDWGLR